MSARSRLRADFGPESGPAALAPNHQSSRVSHRAPVGLDWLARHLHYLPTLAIGLGLLGITWWLVTAVQPAQIRDLPLPHSYGPLLITVFLSCFWIAEFGLLSARRGGEIACLVTLWLFLRLQHLTGATVILIGAIMVFGIIEVLLWSWQRLSQRHHSPKHHHDHH